MDEDDRQFVFYFALAVGVSLIMASGFLLSLACLVLKA
jgi:hypothetical protein